MSARLGCDLAALLLAGGCAGPPSDRLAWSDTWEAVVAGHDGTVLVVRVTQGNTGLLRGQASLDVRVIPPAGSPLEMRRTAVPSDVTHDAEARVVEVASDRVVHQEGTWTALVREGPEALDATVRLVSRAEPALPVVLDEGRRQRSVGAPMPLADAGGAWRSGIQGGTLDGRAVLVREAGDAWPDGRTRRESLYLLGLERGVGVEILGDARQAWTAGPRGTQTGRTARVRRNGRRLEVSLEPDLELSATVTLDRPTLTSRPWSDLTLLERPLACLLAGWPERILERGEALVREPGRDPWTAAAVHVIRAGPRTGGASGRG
ncbi:MAG: hypothetical protein JXB39_12555 [Deltaproteobacteria bacterium]|nr:hypothetical protein [Deltaproteobacteria bacterium]